MPSLILRFVARRVTIHQVLGYISVRFLLGEIIYFHNAEAEGGGGSGGGGNIDKHENRYKILQCRN